MVPQTDVRFYQDDDGSVPVLSWLQQLCQQDARAFAKCYVRLRRLVEAGHDLRRPEADTLRDGIYELRARTGHVQYRILYFFHGKVAAILAHALTKEKAVPEWDIDLALTRKRKLEQQPDRHMFRGDSDLP